MTPEERAAKLRRLRDELATRYASLMRALAASDHLPAPTDGCRTAAGACDGSCAGVDSRDDGRKDTAGG